jgi:hypothetical protein
LNQEIGTLTPALQKATQGINNVQMNLSGVPQEQAGQEQAGQEQAGQGKGQSLWDAAKQTANDVAMGGPNKGVGDIQPAGAERQYNPQAQNNTAFQGGSELYYDNRGELNKVKFLEYDDKGFAKVQMPDGTVRPGISPRKLTVEKPAGYEEITASNRKWVRIV